MTRKQSVVTVEVEGISMLDAQKQAFAEVHMNEILDNVKCAKTRKLSDIRSSYTCKVKKR